MGLERSKVQQWFLQVLLKRGVAEHKILFLTLIAAPEGIHRVCGAFPKVKVITSEIDEGVGKQFQIIPGMLLEFSRYK